jgi:hypothetical protein
MTFETTKSLADAIELNDDELATVGGGEMSAREYALFLLQLAAWAKEKASQPLRLPGL